MKIILATGIYPPDIGGPATYVEEIARQLKERGEEVRVVTYGGGNEGFVISLFRYFVSRYSFSIFRPFHISPLTSRHALYLEQAEPWPVFRVAKNGGPLLRWWRYAKVLRKVGQDADVVIAFSSVSAGVPLWMSRLRKPKRILRLGGDFLWERYTDGGGEKGLKEFYGQPPKWIMDNGQWIMGRLLRSFDHIVFSTRWQEELYEESYASMPPHSVIENALPEGEVVRHEAHVPFRLLFLGRFVAFKNVSALLDALADTPEMALTIAGSGPMESVLRSRTAERGLTERVTFLPPQHGRAKQRLFAEHDLLVLPSLTEISPNVALEARANGLPVLLSSATGLGASLTQGMLLRPLRTPEQIAAALREVRDHYPDLAREATMLPVKRAWKLVADEWRNLLSSLS